MPKPEFYNINNKVAEIVRVNHAGEYGAKRIYEGQLKYIRDLADAPLINSMLVQEKEHLDYFSTQLMKRKVRPTALMPFWHLGGYFLGSSSSFLGSKVAMLVTQAVEEVIEEHYQEQLDYLNEIEEEKELFLNIKKFQDDEVEHKNIAIKHESEKAFLAPILSTIVKNICRVSISLSKSI
jgi:ubiquinone biosynthesis monooxygenase Coq7